MYSRFHAWTLRLDIAFITYNHNPLKIERDHQAGTYLVLDWIVYSLICYRALLWVIFSALKTECPEPPTTFSLLILSSKFWKEHSSSNVFLSSLDILAYSSTAEFIKT